MTHTQEVSDEVDEKG